MEDTGLIDPLKVKCWSRKGAQESLGDMKEVERSVLVTALGCESWTLLLPHPRSVPQWKIGEHLMVLDGRTGSEGS